MDRPRRRRSLNAPGSSPTPRVGGVVAPSDQMRREGRSRPVRSPRERKQRPAWWLPRPVLIASIAIIVIWWFVSPIKRLHIPPEAGNAQEISQAIDAYFGSHTKRNMFINTRSLESALKQTIVHATDVRVRHDVLLSTVHIDVASDRPALRWQTQGVQYTISGLGVALYQTPTKGEESLPLILDSADVPLELKSRIVPPDFITYIQELETATRAARLTIRERRVHETIREIEIRLVKRPYRIRLQTTGRAGEQVHAIQRLEKYFRRAGTQPRAYIDLRIPNRAYWR